MVEEREGEDLGPVDWSHPMAASLTYASPPEQRCATSASGRRIVDVLREAEKHPEQWEVTTDGGWPRCGWSQVLAVRMYDGYPYWKPTPSVFVSTYLGSTWHPFSMISDARRKS